MRWLNYNGYKYKEGLILNHSFSFLEIFKISFDGKDYYFVSKQHQLVQFHKTSNSVQITELEPILFSFIELSKLTNKKVYEKKLIKDEIHIVADTLDLKFKE